MPTLLAVSALALAVGGGFMLTRDEKQPPAAPGSAASPSSSPHASDPVTGGRLAPEHGALVGAWAGVGDPRRGLAGRLAAVRDLEKRLGRQLDIVHNFYAWEDKFDLEQEHQVLAAGQLPLISWNGTDTKAINSGRLDAVIAEHADAVARLGQPVLLRWFWEMDGQKKADLVRSPQQFIAAWHRVRRIFDERGATSVEWVWCPNAYNFTKGRSQLYYPGDSAVDWVCADGYDNAGDGTLEPFPRIFGDFYEWADLTGKPIMIGEFGIDANSGYGQPAWLNDAHRALVRGFPRTRAIVFFDAIGANGNDWRVRSHRGVDAMRRLVHEPAFNTRDSAGTTASAE